MYNDIVMIFLCVFAVYGAYSAFRELVMLVFRKTKVAAAVRIYPNMSENEQSNAIIIAENYVHEHCFLERMPIIICDSSCAEDLQRYGYDIYIKYVG